MDVKDLLTKLYFKIRLYETEGNEFLNLFYKLTRAIDEDFHKITQYGGDDGCDGYSPKLKIHFAVTTQKDRLDEKFLSDFEKYLKNKKADTFVFVLTKKDINIKLSNAIQEKIKEYPELNISYWDFDRILKEYMKLTLEERSEILGDISIPEGDSNEPISNIISGILEIAKKQRLSFASIGTSTITELNKKIDGNNINLLANAIKETASYTSAKKFFDNNLQEAEIFRNYLDSLYNKHKKNSDDADIIIWKIINDLGIEITELNFMNIINIIAFFIEECTLFENIDAKG
ncbi:hypothetical protein A9X77_08385 [Brachyspira hyodysenteriae]|uniref:hypothetical protein n=1 Tax=Brachyspira hyodysenteriae TaxID=159 RepID=UPI00063D917D|nr:hypothetical protein [Brachyspira hyodysenteriae]KLI27636.1 hypothetical protein SR30_01370 [Brachyspira hyodysenteriae]TVL76932.1 hypothetical protein A9X77_08385 [Brachyspira hyodysenteriae]TVL87466.1 hypothetical protein A9X78_10400 [Brachyspira hyodysenteriae]